MDEKEQEVKVVRTDEDKKKLQKFLLHNTRKTIEAAEKSKE